jgi:hypothetical protein
MSITHIQRAVPRARTPVSHEPDRCTRAAAGTLEHAELVYTTPRMQHPRDGRIPLQAVAVGNRETRRKPRSR